MECRLSPKRKAFGNSEREQSMILNGIGISQNKNVSHFATAFAKTANAVSRSSNLKVTFTFCVVIFKLICYI